MLLLLGCWAARLLGCSAAHSSAFPCSAGVIAAPLRWSPSALPTRSCAGRDRCSSPLVTLSAPRSQLHWLPLRWLQLRIQRCLPIFNRSHGEETKMPAQYVV